MIIFTVIPLSLLAALPQVSGHAAMFHPSMFGFNVTQQTFPYDNRPVAPIKNMVFQEWWFHNHLAHPPNPGDIFELPAGKPATVEIACNKGATSFFASSEGGDIRDPNNPNNVCPKSPTKEYHTNGFNDLEGCSLGIAYKSNVTDVQPEDFTVFSVNQTCVWTRFTEFQVPARMPACPEGGCICAFFWIHAPDSGGEENYMNGFKCNVTGSTSTAPVAQSKVARRCGVDPKNKKPHSAPGNCTYGAKTPYYWFNLERNNMFEGTFSPPVYNDLYNFLDGAQNDIFVDSYVSIPTPAPNAPVPVLADVSGTTSSSPSSSNSSSSSSSTSTTTTSSSSNSTSSKTCKSKKNTDSSSSLIYLSARDMKRSHRFLDKSSIMQMSRRSRRLSATKRERLWNMW